MFQIPIDGNKSVIYKNSKIDRKQTKIQKNVLISF